MLHCYGSNKKYSAVLMAASFTLMTFSVIRVSSLPGDMPIIRHGRSRVRHSNEKDHIRWGLQVFDNLTLDYESYDNDTLSAGSGSGNNVGQLFGSDFWLSSDSNGSFINVNTTGVLFKQDPGLLGDFDSLTSQASTTTLPQTATVSQIKKQKKIHKKKIMENIRQNVNKGLEYLKLHTNLEDDEKNALSQEGISQGDGKEHERLSSFNEFYKLNINENIAIPFLISTKSNEQKQNPALKSMKTESNSIGSSKIDDNTKYNDNKKIVSTTALKMKDFHPDQQNTADYADTTDRYSRQHVSNNMPKEFAFTYKENEKLKSTVSLEELSSEVNLEEINIDGSLDEEGGDNVIIGLDNFNADDIGNSFNLEESSRNMETSKYLDGAGDDANEDELYDWDEISRNNRRNLMRGRDVVTRFLQIVETQHSLGSNCEAGTSLNLGEGVVDRYAQDRFRVEAEVAVNRANMLTRIFKMASSSVQSSVNLLHASVLSMVEFDDDIFAAGNCFDWNQHPSQPGLFCPFAYRLPPPNHGALFAKDLATEYHYLGNTSEWFYLARKNAEKVIARNDQFIKAFHLYSNKTEEKIEEDTLFVRYEDGRWSKPYYDCGGGNIWMLTYTVPFFGYENGTYFFKGTSGIDIDLRRVDIDQCPQRNTPGATQPLNIFAGTDKCKQRTTMCEALKGLGFRRGSYKCVCRKGFYFPDTLSLHKFFNGSVLEEEYEKLMLGKNSTYNIVQEYECLPCAEGCESCEDSSPCIAALNWPMRTSILVLACTIIGLLPPAAWFTFRYQQVKVVRAASPALLRVIAMGAFFIYFTTIVMYPNPSLYTCTAKIWLREIGFSLTYGALMLKTWRISVIFRVRSAKAVKITDAALLKRLGVICGVIGTFLLVRTLVSPPDVVVGRTADDLKAFLCKTDWWDYTFTSMEVLFLAWGVRLCIMVRKAPSEFNESRFISMAIYNEFLLTCFLNVSMLFLQSPANPDLLYIIFFCHTQLTVTLLLGLIFGSKVYIVLRSGKAHQESIGMGAKSSGAKFNFRPQVRTFANPSSATTSTAQLETKLSDQEALEEVRLLSVQLQRIQEMAPPKGVAVMTISQLLDGLKSSSSSQLQTTSKSQQQTATCNIQMFSTNSDIQKYQQNNNYPTLLPITTMNTEPKMINLISVVEKSVNTSMTGEDFMRDVMQEKINVKCDNCKQKDKVTRTVLSCQQLGSPHPDGSINFSNIKLDCMCSHPADLDRICETGEQIKKLPITKTVATNTIMLTSRGGRRNSRTKVKSSKCYSSSNIGVAKSVATGKVLRKKFDEKYDLKAIHCDNHKSNEHFLVCTSCRNKLSSSLKKLSNLSSVRRKSRIVMHQSNELLDRSACEALSAITGSFSSTTSTIGVYAGIASNADDLSPAKKKIHSTDDITFYTTDDDSNENPNDFDEKTFSKNLTDEPSTSSSTSILTGCVSPKVVRQLNTNESQSNISSASSGAKQPVDATKTLRRPDKLLLDLNDRSKYTKEVSV